MKRKLKYYWLFVFFVIFNNSFSKDIYLNDRGVVGDGFFDNWLIIQKAIDDVIESGGGTVYFPQGEFAIYNNSLVIWGSNITLSGIDSKRTKIIKRGNPGYFGDCLNIVGLIPGYYYYGILNKSDYTRRSCYSGESIISKNVNIRNIGIETFLEEKIRSKANNIGILNADNVFFENCIIANAPQSNVAVVNDTELAKNKKIKFLKCSFINSGQHNVRVISYNKGSIIGNDVSFFLCDFSNVESSDIYQKEIYGYKIHLWYRGQGDSSSNSLYVKDCSFDSSGFLYCNGVTTNMIIEDSNIFSYIYLYNLANRKNYNVKVINTNIYKLGDFKNMLTKINNKSSNCSFVEETYGIKYECKTDID